MSGVENRIGLLIKPLLDAQSEQIKQSITISEVNITTLINALATRLDVLEKLSGSKTRKEPTKEKKAAEKADEETDKPKKKFPVNKAIWFKDSTKTNWNFAAPYVKIVNEKCGVDLLKIVDEDATVKSKKKEDQKLNAKVTAIYNYIKTNCKDALTQVETDYTKARAAHNQTNEPEQETVEANTDDEADGND